MNESPTHIVCCSSSEDTKMKDKLVNHIKTSMRHLNVQIQDYDVVPGGSEPAKEIENRLASADIILLLISADFLGSDNHSKWMSVALEQHAKIFPIILRPCDWQNQPFSHLVVLPIGTDSNITPISNWPDPDNALESVAIKIQEAVKALKGQNAQETVIPRSTPKYTSNNGQIDQGRTKKLFITKPIIVAVVIILILTSVLTTIRPPKPIGHLPTLPNKLGVVEFPDGNYIGVNDGSSLPLDVFSGSIDSQFKKQAAQALSKHDEQTAVTLWKDVLAKDPHDAEARIYLENIRAVASRSYTTLVVALDFTTPFPDISSQSVLQGAYTAQKQFNDAHHGVDIRLLIANTAGKLAYVAPVAQQIVSVAQQEKVVGVLGWQSSQSCFEAISILQKGHIPIISQMASNDSLTDYSQNFFRIVSPVSSQTSVAAKFTFASQPMGLNTRRAVVFFDTHDDDSKNTAQDFEQSYKDLGGNVIDEEEWSGGNQSHQPEQQMFAKLINHALAYKPDVFYFASMSNSDMTNFQNALPTTGLYATLPVISTDGFDPAQSHGLSHWYFTAYGYLDEWSIVTHNNIAAPFFQEYSKNFDPTHTHLGIYGFDRANAMAMLSYDATIVLSQAVRSEYDSAQPLNPLNILATIPKITFQGVSGYIAFRDDHDPQNKTIAILAVSHSNTIHVLCLSGTFYPGMDQAQVNCPA